MAADWTVRRADYRGRDISLTYFIIPSYNHLPTSLTTQLLLAQRSKYYRFRSHVITAKLLRRLISSRDAFALSCRACCWIWVTSLSIPYSWAHVGGRQLRGAARPHLVTSRELTARSICISVYDAHLHTDVTASTKTNVACHLLRYVILSRACFRRRLASALSAVCQAV